MKDKKVKIKNTAQRQFLLSLPGNVKVWGGHITTIHESLLENPAVKKYLASGRLVLVDEEDAKIPAEDMKVEKVDMIEEGPDAILVGAIKDDGTFVPKEEVEMTTEKPRAKSGKKTRAEAPVEQVEPVVEAPAEASVEAPIETPPTE